MHLNIILLVLVVIFLAELPDKSLIASLILGSKHKPLYVWLGAASAFLVHVIIAVTAGKLISLLPHKTTDLVVGLIFLLGAGLLLFNIRRPEEEIDKSALEHNKGSSFKKAYLTAFGAIFLGEWGDITQLTTANYAAKYHSPWSVGIGAVLGLWLVTAMAIILGNKLLRYIKPRLIQSFSALILVIFSVVSLVKV